MLRLIAFGGLTLIQDGRAAAGAAAGRRRLALLALLTSSRARALERDVIAELLWPDSEPALARHSLHQLIFAIRRAHGIEDLLTGAPVLHLDPAHITSDVWEFEDAVRRHEFERAVTAYHGPFADGFSLPGAGELQRRLDASRSRYARDYSTALETLARDAATSGDHASCVRWRRLLADANPLSAQAARGLIEALVAAGERPQALQFALVHEALVRGELDSAADPEIAAWIVRLRTTRESASRPNGGTRAASGAESVRRALDPTTDAPDAHLRQQLAHLTRAIGSNYRVEALVDTSSIAATYSASTTTGARHSVEVHVIQPRIAAMASSKRFVEVLETVTRLTSRRIHPTLAFGVAENLLFYVASPRAELSLRNRLSRERELPIRDAISIARDIAEALAEVHRVGLRHGDLRPKYVGLTTFGAVIASVGVIDAITPDARTGDGSTILTFGSPAYLSPEQVSTGVPGDARSDIYAFGCILYEMLAGEPPFGRASRSTVSTGSGAKLTGVAPPLRARRESVPEALSEVVHTCLARVPADRYSSGDEVVRALAAVAPTPRH